MTQIFILGSSSVYGVGASTAGWGDLIKQYIHNSMYKPGGNGETHEVYNMGKSGATIDFVQKNFLKWLEQYGRDGEIICVVCVGGNNSKAEEEPDNFVSTPEEFTQEMTTLIEMLRTKSNGIIMVGNGWVDESKTNPKHNPLTGGKSYMTNERRQKFTDITKELCKKHGIPFIELELSEEEWLDKYIYQDGLHPNQDGHQMIFEAIKPELEKLL